MGDGDARIGARIGRCRDHSVDQYAFRTARGLHGNFYENEKVEDEAVDSVQSSEQLSDRLFWPDWSSFLRIGATSKPEEHHCTSDP